MHIEDHRLVGVDYQQTPNISSRRITPRLLVEHYTAGFSFSGARSWLTKRGSSASCHVLIGNEPGEIVQLAAFNQRAWHAGPSKWGKYSSLNDYAIGIEITNVGWLRKQSDGSFRDWTGKNVFREGEGYLYGRTLIAQPHPRVGGGMLYWPSFLPWQLEMNAEVVEACHREYGLEAILSHEEIDTRGWKTDPGPQFPMQDARRILGNDRSDEEPGAPDLGEVDRLTRSLADLRDIITAELDRTPADERRLRWRHAEVGEKAIEALKGD